jgi:hypothetical protein
MDLKKVRMVALGAVVVAAGVGLYLMTRPEQPEQKTAAIPPTTPEEAAADERRKRYNERMLARLKAREGQERKKEAFPLRDLDREILRLAEEGRYRESAKDVLPKHLAQIDLTVKTDPTSGRTVVTHANVDLNRDSRVDERWTFGEKIKRDARSIDDLRGWVDEFVLEDDQWKLEDGRGHTAGQQPAERPPNAGPLELRDLDKRVLQAAKSPPEGKIVEDLTPGEPQRVMLHKSGRKVQRVAIDYDRDTIWDEQWIFGREGEIQRAVSPEDNGRYTERWTLRDNHWVRI